MYFLTKFKKMSEGDSKKIEEPEEQERRKYKKLATDISNVFQSIRIRCSIQINNGLDGFLLDYGRYILYFIGPIFWGLYGLFELSK